MKNTTGAPERPDGAKQGEAEMKEHRFTSGDPGQGF